MMTQVTSAVKISQWENEISSSKKKKDHGKKALLEEVEMADKN